MHESPWQLALICIAGCKATSHLIHLPVLQQRKVLRSSRPCQPLCPGASQRYQHIPLARAALSHGILKAYDTVALLCPDQYESFILSSSHKAESTHISPDLPCALLLSKHSSRAPRQHQAGVWRASCQSHHLGPCWQKWDGESSGGASRGHSVSPRRGQCDLPQPAELRTSTLVPASLQAPTLQEQPAPAASPAEVLTWYRTQELDASSWLGRDSAWESTSQCLKSPPVCWSLTGANAGAAGMG